jgi:uncharacterized protein (DUF1501 family)
MPVTSCRNFCLSQRFHRREVLRAGGLSLLGLSLPELLSGWAAAQSNAARVGENSGSNFGKAKACILLFMWGGPAQQDTWDLKPDAPAEVRGPFNPIATLVPDIRICEHFPLLARRTDKLAIVRSMTHNNVDHTVATHFLLTGMPPIPGGSKYTDWPHIGSVLSRLGRGTDPLPPFVSMRPKLPGDVPRFVEESRGQFAGWLGQSFDPLTIDANPAEADYRVGDFNLPAEISAARLDDRRSLLTEIDRQVRTQSQCAAMAAMDRHYRRSFDLLHSAVGKGAFDLDAEPIEVRRQYGLNPHGQSVLQARRLVERGVPLVTVFWPNDGIKNVSVYWDTHSRNFIDLKERLMPAADLAFSTLLDDLESRGLLDETLILWTGEFGRTPKIGQVNSDAGAGADGRDHWPNCFTSVLAGGGIRRGIVYGASDRHAAYPAANAVPPVDLMATMYHCLGIAPEQTLPDKQGRPQAVCPGSPIGELIA